MEKENLLNKQGNYYFSKYCMTPLKDQKVEDYCLKIQELVKQLKKTSKKALVENEAYNYRF